MNEVQVDAEAVIRRLQTRLAEATYNLCVLEAQVEAMRKGEGETNHKTHTDPVLETVDNN